ncbi:MAG: pilus assembly PilX N-terminal domain-containing protein [bacterium]
MNTISETKPHRRGERIARRPRRGVALVIVLIFVIAMAALAMSSIFMAANANLLAKSYDRERDLKYAAEAALAIGKSRVNADPSILVMHSITQLDTAIMLNQSITGADGIPLAGIKVNVYVGPTGSTSGQFGRFSSIVAEARDARGNGFIRRLELTQESFAKFAYWSNSESNGSATIFFNNADELWGPVWSNDTISIGSGGAKFHDEVGTTFFVSGASYGVFSKGKKEYQKAIPLPSTSTLLTLKTISATSGWDFTSGRAGSTNEASVLDRIEFLATDLNASGDSTDLNEGMFRIYTARSDAYLRGDYPAGTPPSVSNVDFCGDWHVARIGTGGSGTNTLQFYPASEHNTTWFYNQIWQGLRDKNPGWTTTQVNTAATTARNENLNSVMTQANARCYLPGDPHLVAIERNGPYKDPITPGVNYTTAAWQRGGSDTTFTPDGVTGTWKVNTATPDTLIRRLRGIAGDAGKIGDAKYLYPLDRVFNAGAKGVIHFSGNVGLSGTMNGRVTLYSNGTIVLLDDLRYANDPVKGVCRDILGIIADKDIVIADNSLNTPQLITGSSGYNALDDTQDFTIHAVMMALGNSFRVEHFDQGPTNVNGCGAVVNARGCIFLSGGIIQNSRGPVGQSNGRGFSKQYSYDHCAIVNPPPYFPTTGRFQDNRYLELDPAGFNHLNYFKSITPDP